VIRRFDALKENDFRYCINEDPWQHHFERDNYLPLQEFSPAELARQLEGRSFVKLGKNIPLNEWDNAIDLLMADFMLLVELSGDQFPRR
jgi:hypothetical protein